MATSPPVVRAAATGAAKLLRVRWLVRAPIWAYRARLGAVFGSRLVMLEHTGRTAPAVARVLSRDQAEAALAAYAAARPRAWATLKPALEKTLGAEVGDLPMVALNRGPGTAAQAG